MDFTRPMRHCWNTRHHCEVWKHSLNSNEIPNKNGQSHFNVCFLPLESNYSTNFDETNEMPHLKQSLLCRYEHNFIKLNRWHQFSEVHLHNKWTSYNEVINSEIKTNWESEKEKTLWNLSNFVVIFLHLWFCVCVCLCVL